MLTSKPSSAPWCWAPTWRHHLLFESLDAPWQGMMGVKHQGPSSSGCVHFTQDEAKGFGYWRVKDANCGVLMVLHSTQREDSFARVSLLGWTLFHCIWYLGICVGHGYTCLPDRGSSDITHPCELSWSFEGDPPYRWHILSPLLIFLIITVNVLSIN